MFLALAAFLDLPRSHEWILLALGVAIMLDCAWHVPSMAGEITVGPTLTQKIWNDDMKPITSLK